MPVYEACLFKPQGVEVSLYTLVRVIGHLQEAKSGTSIQTKSNIRLTEEKQHLA
jgi:hypothetical protein